MTMEFDIFGQIHDAIPDIAPPILTPQLVGHRKIADQLASNYNHEKLHHALLFIGPRGIGKATLAFQLAWHLFSNPRAQEAPSSFHPTDQNSSLFRQMASRAYPGMLYISRPYNEKTKQFRTAITVDEIRQINHFLSRTSHDGSYRVIIIDGAEDMNTNSANAVLKNLEEPPANTLFILISHAPGRLLPTIHSRCQTHRFEALNDDDLFEALALTHTQVPDDSAERSALINHANGSVREAIMLKAYGGLEIAQAVNELIDSADFNVTQASKIASVVSAKDATIAFDLFHTLLLQRISADAQKFALLGQAKIAFFFAELYDETSQTISDCMEYNLDKRLHTISLLNNLHMRMHQV